MPQSRSLMYAHVVFGTRGRLPFLSHAKVRGELNSYITGICGNQGARSVQVGGMPDHVHLLARMSREHVLDEVVREVRQGSSNWLQSRHRMLDFDWDEDYVAFSVSASKVDAVTSYIRRQEQHHRQMTFLNEIDGLLRRTPRPTCRDQVYVHFIFSTKNRLPSLADKDVREEMYGYMEKIYPQWGTTALRLGGYEDHVHILGTLSNEFPVARIVQELKRASTVWIKKRHGMEDFDWQDGYGAFSVSPTHVDEVVRYIERQEDHHGDGMSAHPLVVPENPKENAKTTARPTGPGSTK